MPASGHDCGHAVRRIWARGAVFVSASAIGALVTVIVSCATNAATDPPANDASSAVPDTDGGGAKNEPPDAGCDASDPGCITEVVPCETVSWCLSPSPADARLALTAVWGSSATDVWAVGGGGTIVHHDGADWVVIPSGQPETFYAVWGSGPRDVWVASTTELLLHTSGFAEGTASRENAPFSTHSTERSDPASSQVFAIWGTSVNNVRIAGPSRIRTVETASFRYAGPRNHAAKSRMADGGVLWRVLPGDGGTIRAIWGGAADDVWMVGDRGMTLHGTPYLGELPNPALRAGPGACDRDCFEGCTACAIASDELAWSPVDSQTIQDLEAVWGSSSDDVWAVGARGTIVRMKKGQDRWQAVESPTTEHLRAVWGSGPDDVWIAGDEGTILHYDGQSVSPASVQLPLGPRPALRGMWGSGANDIWVVGDRATILHYTGPKAGTSNEVGGP